MVHPLSLFHNLSENSFLYGYSALDDYLGVQQEGFYRVLTGAGLVDLGMLTERVLFPGEQKIDALMPSGGKDILIECADFSDKDSKLPGSFKIPFYKDLKSGFYKDPIGLYPVLKSLKMFLKTGTEPEFANQDAVNFYIINSYHDLSEAAILLSRYKFPLKFQINLENRELLSPLLQREILTQVLTGAWAELGLSFLMENGFIHSHWPEIAELNKTLHSKEYHPEGNVWEHTLATLKYRKTRDISISLALFLHDLGKPFARENEGRTFDKHAQIGSKKAERFLSSIGYSKQQVDSVVFLVKEHMLPAAVSKLPASRVEKVLSSPLFPHLLEVYRCDLSSTFRGPQGFYDACKTYRTFLRNRKNPFRDSSGKKIFRLYVE